jgi:hypothetical protein
VKLESARARVDFDNAPGPNCVWLMNDFFDVDVIAEGASSRREVSVKLSPIQPAGINLV